MSNVPNAPRERLTLAEVEDAYNAASMYRIQGWQDGTWNVKADFAEQLCILALEALKPESEKVAQSGETPRTDAAEFWDEQGQVVSAEFARTLERELAEARQIGKKYEDRYFSEAKFVTELEIRLRDQEDTAREHIAYGQKQCHRAETAEAALSALQAERDKEVSARGSTFRPEVIAYATAMQFKLDKNAKKKGWPEQDKHGNRGWKSCQPMFLEGKLQEEVGELLEALLGSDMEAIRHEAADVGNICMMLADNAGALAAAPAEAARWRTCQHKECRDCCSCGWPDDCAATVAPVPEVESTPWVSVNDRLPEHSGMYLAVREGDALSELCAHIYDDGKWVFGDGSDMPEYPVTFWMPIPALPAPYMNNSTFQEKP